MLQSYIAFCCCIWGFLVFLGFGGGMMFDFSAAGAHRPAGPGQHFHK